MDIDANSKFGQSREQRTDVFISYSRQDKKTLGELNIMLQPLVRLGTITTWDDTQIRAGAKWREEIDNVLRSARVAVLLVSPEFLASDFITKVELPALLGEAEQDGLTILWVAVSFSLYRVTAIAKYQAANDPAMPLAALSRWKRAKELLGICEKILQAATTKPVRKTPAEVTHKAVIPSAPPRRVEFERHSRTTQDDPTEYLVNFEDERDLFKKMLDDSAKKRLMFIQAPDGRGKTSLLLMLGFYCEREGIPYCSIDSQQQQYDNPHFTLAHAMCTQLGLSPRHLAQALQPLSVYRSQGEIDDPYIVSQIFAGVNPTHDGLRHRYIQERLRDAFIADLGQLVTQKGQIVCLFDNLHSFSPEEEDWLLETLLTPVKSGKLKGVTIVTAGRRWPEINRRTWARNVYFVDGLSLLNAKHIKAYAEKLNIKITDEEAKYYLTDTRGIPLHVTILVRNLGTQSEVA